MKLGENLHGGVISWSTSSIRKIAEEGGGIPPHIMAVVSDDGDIVAWDPLSGEVRTAIPHDHAHIRVDRLGALVLWNAP